jgi:hypothetical protein
LQRSRNSEDKLLEEQIMPSTKHSGSTSWAIVAVVIASATVMNFTFISANRSSLTLGVRSARASEHSRADASNPLSVTPSLDSTRVASATMAEDGGTLSVMAANGTTFTLTIPADALVSEEEITMTPVAQMPDLPFSLGLGSGGAVQLGPEGLLLVKPATLVIQTPSPISIDQQSSFA